MNKPNNMRRRASRDRIATAFVRLLQDRELSSLSVTEICKTADVNRTTFYANYMDIYDLADAVQKRPRAPARSKRHRLCETVPAH